MIDRKCARCNGRTEGYVCDRCDKEFSFPNDDHDHGVSHQQPKCATCDKPEMQCFCPPRL